MREYLKSIFKNMFWKYTYFQQEIKQGESKRYLNYITSEFKEEEQSKLILDLKADLVEYRKTQIEESKRILLREQIRLESLIENLKKLEND